MGAKYKTMSDSKSGTTLFLAGGIVLLTAAVVLYFVLKEPPTPELLKTKATSYLKSISVNKVYEAFELESVCGKVPLARYQEAIGKQFDLDRKPMFRDISTDLAIVKGNDATVKWQVTLYFADKERTELRDGVMNFHHYDKGWLKEPDEALQALLKEQEAPTE